MTSVEHTLRPDHLPSDLLQYLPLYKVVVCTSCRYAVQPKAITRHLSEIHHISSLERQRHMKRIEEFELASHELVMRYKPRDFPVPQLPVRSGLQCTFECCSYLCVAEKRMKHHWRHAHGRQGQIGSDWKVTPVQTFFMGNLLHYFTVPPVGDQAERVIARDARQDISDKGNEHPSILGSPTSVNSPTLDELDLLILEHFNTHTWKTLATIENTKEMWRDIVPHVAHQHGFVMHALLACTALHMAYVNPDRYSELVIKARTHQDHAIPQFRATVSVVEGETCGAVYMFALLLAVTAFTLDISLPMALEKEDTLPNWLFFIQSGCTMFCDIWERIDTGPVKRMAESWKFLEEASKSPHQPLLDYLLAIPPADWPDEVRMPYNDSAFALARTFSCMEELDMNVDALDVVRFWPIKNCLEYVTLLNNWHPGALILLAHYCVVLHRLEATNWYLRGAAVGILSTTVQRLNPAWHQYIQGPLGEVGLGL